MGLTAAVYCKGAMGRQWTMIDAVVIVGGQAVRGLQGESKSLTAGEVASFWRGVYEFWW